MSELINTLESLETPDREVADQVLLEFGWRKRIARYIDGDTPMDCWQWQSPSGKTFYADRPNPLASIDDAVALIPEGWSYVLEDIRLRDERPWAVVGHVVPSNKPKFPVALTLNDEVRHLSIGATFKGSAANIPTAITIAALKAIQHTKAKEAESNGWLDLNYKWGVPRGEQDRAQTND